MITVKKILSLPLLILLAVVLLTSCGKNNTAPDDPVGSSIDLRDGSYEGTIESLPVIDVYQQGTHLLFSDNGEAIIIQSPSIDLNKYLDEEVRVEGVVTQGIGNTQDVFTVSSVEYLDETRSQEITSYENKLYGFHIEYPVIWFLSEENGEVSLSYAEKHIVSIKIFNDEKSLDTLIDSEEEGDGVEVTIGAQRSMRFLSEGNIRFYVPNPPKKKIYLIKYTPTLNKVDEPKKAEKELDIFYNLLESFELIYSSPLSGDKCGGLQKLTCSEEFRCELEGAGKYAEGVCVSVESNSTTISCPFISAPGNCNEYRISEYNQGGCPARYECVEGGEIEKPTFRDLNVVDDSSTDGSLSDATEQSDYEIPEVSDVSREYVNSQKNFTVLYPKNWYYASFGSIEDSIWTIGFSDTAFEEVEEAIIKLRLMDKDGGRVSKKINEIFYTVDGPVDLAEVMEAIANSIEAF